MIELVSCFGVLKGADAAFLSGHQSILVSVTRAIACWIGSGVVDRRSTEGASTRRNGKYDEVTAMVVDAS